MLFRQQEFYWLDQELFREIIFCFLTIENYLKLIGLEMPLITIFISLCSNIVHHQDANEKKKPFYFFYLWCKSETETNSFFSNIVRKNIYGVWPVRLKSDVWQHKFLRGIIEMALFFRPHDKLYFRLKLIYVHLVLFVIPILPRVPKSQRTYFE